MPEAPEVESCRRALLRWTRDAPIRAVRVPDPACLRRVPSTLPSDALPDGAKVAAALFTGARTKDVRRVGKRIGWTFRDRPQGVLVHLGMTGRWMRRRDESPNAKVRLVLEVGDAELWFEDGRRFGCVVPMPAADLPDALASGQGPDAIDDPPDKELLRALLRGRRPVKIALMDQAVIAGLGNIHSAEVLWRAKVHPEIACDALSDAAIARLAAAIPEQVRRYVDDADEIEYVNLGGPNPFAIYGREGEPCSRCGEGIARIGQGGRSTFFCPRCQRADDRA